jgi:hypothetical protein
LRHVPLLLHLFEEDFHRYFRLLPEKIDQAVSGAPMCMAD